MDASRTGGANSGNSWTDAYTDLQSALGDANCTEIWVAAGVYKPTSNPLGRSSTFNVHPDVAVYGGFNGTELTRGARNWTLNVTILSGDIDGNDAHHLTTNIDVTAADISGGNSYHVVTMSGLSTALTASTVLDGFTLTGGQADAADPDNLGAGFVCKGYGASGVCSPTLGNLRFSGNLASYGAAMYNNGSSGGISSPGLSNATISGNLTSASSGGGAGMYNDGTGGTSSPVLSNVTFSNNAANLGFGGAMENVGTTSGNSSPSLTTVTFSSNSASSGGAIYNTGVGSGTSSPVLANASFIGNSATANGGAVYSNGAGGTSSPIIHDSSFSGNSANIGGALYNNGESAGQSSPTLTRVDFNGNSASLAAGAIYNDGEFGVSSPTLTDVAFKSNSATGGSGGAMINDGSTISGHSSPTLTNVVFVGNTAAGDGGAIYNQAINGGTSSPTLTNGSFSLNEANGGRGGAILNDGSGNGTSSPVLANAILWGDGATLGGSEIYNRNNLGTPGISYSDIQGSGGSGGSWTSALGTDGGGNIDADPLFINAAGSDLRLQQGSPAIDAGNNAAVPGGITEDVAGNPRFVNDPSVPDTGNGVAPIVDMGAYEEPLACPGGTRLYVNQAAAGTNTGDSWTNAFTHLEYALDTIGHCSAPNEVWVAAGVYKPGTTQNATFTVPPGTAVYGGFNGTESSLGARNWVTHLTVLSGDVDSNDANAGTTNIDSTAADIVGANSYHVLRMDGTGLVAVTGTTVLDGFTVTGGQANGAFTDDRGGGLYCDGHGSPSAACSPTLANLVFSGNFGSTAAGALMDRADGGNSSPTLTNISFIGNSTIGTGGAIWSEGEQGGFANPILTNVTFSGNSANGGGAMANDGNQGTSNPTLANVTFEGNTALSGGAMDNDASSGGVSEATMTNVTFHNNSATNQGGAMVNFGTIPDWPGATVTLTNVILWGDTATNGGNEIYNIDYAANIDHSVVQGGCGSIPGASCGAGDLSGDPLLGPLANYGGYEQTRSLLAGSSAIDAATNSGCPATDERGISRPRGARCDIGAYERIPANASLGGGYQTNVAVFRPSTGGWFVKTLLATTFGLSGDDPLPHDFNGDGISDIAVYRPSTSAWFVKTQFATIYGLPGDVPVPGDYDGNGTADLAVYRPSSSAWFVKNQFATSFGLPGDIPVPGDYNGDGQTDVAVFRPSTGAWFIRGQFAAIFGLPGDIPVPGDYNGDGITDLAVFRPSTNAWFVRGQFSTIYGVSGDIPVPGDYDGNATTDVAVFRPSTNGWFIKNVTSTIFGLSGDYPLPAPDTNADGDPYQ